MCQEQKPAHQLQKYFANRKYIFHKETKNLVIPRLTQFRMRYFYVIPHQRKYLDILISHQKTKKFLMRNLLSHFQMLKCYYV